MKERFTNSSGNALVGLGFPQEEAAALTMRAKPMARLRTLIVERGRMQQKASKRPGIAQSRVSDLVRGKWETLNLDVLLTLAARAKQQSSIVLKAA
jgi:predicted XRE-type DNA-binding protein